jgi:hypothetical protein
MFMNVCKGCAAVACMQPMCRCWWGCCRLALRLARGAGRGCTATTRYVQHQQVAAVVTALSAVEAVLYVTSVKGF